MEYTILIWELVHEKANESTIRHCPNCNGKVEFRDTSKRRHNANGRDIYEYAIYKCEKGHTWNKFLKTYKASGEYKPIESAASEKGCIESINPEHVQQRGIQRIEILLEKVVGRWRLDKILAEQIEGWSRSYIEKQILAGRIRLDEQVTKPSTGLKGGQRISIDLI